MSEVTLRSDRAGRRQAFATGVLVVLVVVAVYEVAVAFGWIPLGDEPGEDAFGAEAMRLVGVVTLLAGAGVTCLSIRRPERISRAVGQLLPLAGAGLVTATAYAFDPYFAPDEVRYVDRTFPTTVWLAVVVITAVAAALTTRVDARLGLGAATVVLLVCAVTLLFTGTGH